MKIITKTLLGIALFTLILSSCIKERLVGEGNITTETRNLSNFDRIGIAGKRNVTLVKSTESKVEISGYSNLVNAYKERINNGRLTFDYPNSTYVRNDNIQLKIYTPDLSAVYISGNCDMAIGEGFTGNNLNIEVSGSGEVTMQAGTYEKLDVKVSGSAKIDVKPVIVKNADLYISGSGDIKLSVTENLKARISGSGKVLYWGNPTTDVKVSGSGQALKQ